MNDSVIAVVAAHPDDEVLGAGGTIARLVSEGATVHPLILGTGAAARGGDQFDAVSELVEASYNAAAALGMEKPTHAALPDNRFDAMPLLDLVQIVERWLETIHPSLIFTHFGGDLNVDHRLTAKAVLTATRPGTSSVQRILAFETPSATEWAFGAFGRFLPTVYYALGADHLSRKWDALHAYQMEMRQHPHPRSVANLRDVAAVRGREVCRNAAEAFVLVRETR